jgi:hypothetical protein
MHYRRLGPELLDAGYASSRPDVTGLATLLGLQRVERLQEIFGQRSA